MTNSNTSVDEKWIHSFAVTDVSLHPKKFTVYKITSVVRIWFCFLCKIVICFRLFGVLISTTI